MRAIGHFLMLVLLAFLCPMVWGTTWHVAPPPLGSDLHPGSEEEPFATIQKGVDSAFADDIVIVAEGTYVENIHLDGKNIVVRSADPDDPEVVSMTILDGGEAGCVVTLNGTENELCVLEGLTIRNGKGDYGGGICGGTLGIHSQATIRRNVIMGNSSIRGGGIALSDGPTQGNIIIENSAQWGGGLAFCDGDIRNNLIAGNFAEVGGGGLAHCNGTIESNTVTSNLSDGGGGLYECAGIIRNCVIWENISWYDAQLHASSIPTYSCIQDWTVDGEGNISENPRFLDPDGPDDDPSTYHDNDYRLSAGSPCIDAGTNDDWLWIALDLDGNPRILYGGFSLTVDIGAYEFPSFGGYNSLSVFVFNKHDPEEVIPGTVISITPIVGVVRKPLFAGYVPTGAYEISVTAPCFASENRSVEVTVDSPVALVVLLSPNPGAVLGKVMDSDDDEEIPGARVRLTISSGVFAGIDFEAATDGNGEFGVSDLPAQIEYQVAVWKPGYFKYEAVFFLKACETKDLGTIALIPSVSIVRNETGSFTVTWRSMSGRLYKVYYGEALGHWSLAASDIQ